MWFSLWSRAVSSVRPWRVRKVGGIPADFDVAGFLQASKTNFINLQAAWNRSDMVTLRAMMTDDMLAQIKAQLAEREREAPGAANVTEVVMLEAVCWALRMRAMNTWPVWSSPA